MNGSFYRRYTQGKKNKKIRLEMHIIKNLNINSKLSGLEVKMQAASFPLETLSFRVVPHLHDS